MGLLCVPNLRLPRFRKKAHHSTTATATATATATNDMNPIYNQIVLFGDSITQFSFDPNSGWGGALSNNYQRKADVLNRGFAGYNTDWALPILRQLLPLTSSRTPSTPRLLLLTIFFGANDAALPFSNQHVPLVRYSSNLEALASLISSPNSPYYSPDTRLIFITPPPLDEDMWAERCRAAGREPDRKAAVTLQYVRAAREVGRKIGVPVADVWAAIMRKVDPAYVEDDGEKKGEEEVTNDSGLDVSVGGEQKEGIEMERDLSEFLSDGLHLTAAGNQVLYRTVFDQIRKYYPDVDPDNMREVLPSFRELSQDNYEELTKFSPLNKQD